MCSTFTNFLLKTQSKWIPYVRKWANNIKNLQWMTNTIKHILTRKKNLYLEYRQTQSDDDYLPPNDVVREIRNQTYP